MRVGKVVIWQAKKLNVENKNHFKATLVPMSIKALARVY